MGVCESYTLLYFAANRKLRAIWCHNLCMTLRIWLWQFINGLADRITHVESERQLFDRTELPAPECH